ncbi:MAG: DUF354 domain-containing protein [Solirubrobacterales bacterium]|nr:DUF354 domain-containing protein [Solirubrobacterales bacterium]
MSRFWVDIDNPPQAQYLSPIARGLRERGNAVLVTARDHEQTLAVLANRGEAALPVVSSFGASKPAKYAGTVYRILRLVALVRRQIGTPDAVVSTSRSGVLAARLLGCPIFTVLDYEGVEIKSFLRSGTTILHPQALPAAVFEARGFPANRLQSFPGLKEDIALLGLERKPPVPLALPPPRDESIPSVLLRPPSETSHYRVDESIRVLKRLTGRLSSHADIQVVFTPRDREQIELIRFHDWLVQPVIIERPLPVLELLNSVDHVVTGGGTMLREAAWFGIPASTLFQGQLPAIDRWLEKQGAIRRITTETDLESFEWFPTDGPSRVEHHPETLGFVLDQMERGAQTPDRS